MKLADLVLLPAAFGLLALVPPVWWFLRSSERIRAQRLERFVGPRTPVLAGESSTRRRRLRHTLSVGGFALAILAVVQPAWGIDPRKLELRGVDVLVCLDVSRSMLARDLQPDRLGRAHDEIRTLSRRVRDDRLGLVAFAGDARLMIPLTRDMDSFAELVERVDTLSVDRGGTDLGAALETALSALEGGSLGNHEAILLVSDGEDLEGRGLRAAQACKDQNITVHCVGLGSAIGSKIALRNGAGESFLRDRRGRDVVSRLDDSGLRAIAAATGGEYLDVSQAARPLVQLYESHLLSMAGKATASLEGKARKNHFQWPLLAAFLLFLVEFSLSERRSRR